MKRQTGTAALKKVKKFKQPMPNEAGMYDQEAEHILWLDPRGDCTFGAFIPEYVAITTASGIEEMDNEQWFVRGCDKENVIEKMRLMFNNYVEPLKRKKKRRVIEIHFKSYSHLEEWERAYSRGGIGTFEGSKPRLSFDYNVLWEAGGDLYKQDAPEEMLRRIGPAPRTTLNPEHDTKFIIPWTQEAEDFCEDFNARLSHLIRDITEFFMNPEKNILAATRGEFLLLPPCPSASDNGKKDNG